MQHLTSFASLATRYDGFIIDLWGVIHDGVTPYAGAVECLAQLRMAGKLTLLLSNAPRRAHVAQVAMRGMGIADDAYSHILTSGEATHQALRDRTDPYFAALGKHVFHLGLDRDRNVLEDLPLERVATPAEADWVLNTGPDDHRDPNDLGEYETILARCHENNLPMVCANPDLEVIRGGHTLICAGRLAERYEEMGGVSRSIGKPDAAIYAQALARLGVAQTRVLAIGDALRTDIAGARAAGIESCWVLGGIHNTIAHDPALVEAAADGAGLSPLATIPAFVW